MNACQDTSGLGFHLAIGCPACLSALETLGKILEQEDYVQVVRCGCILQFPEGSLAGLTYDIQRGVPPGATITRMSCCSASFCGKSRLFIYFVVLRKITYAEREELDERASPSTAWPVHVN
jgi:hypothetical protein